MAQVKLMKPPEVYDFAGYATRYGIPCSDGRTIEHGAFAHQVGVKVPLVWYHGHSSPDNVLGHAYLFPKSDGVYTYAVFNSTQYGAHAKTLVQAGDVSALSIWANGLNEEVVSKTGKRLVHKGNIRELSIVVAGANPGADIDEVIHFADGEEVLVAVVSDAIILHKEENDVSDEPATESEPTIGEILKTFNQDQTDLLHFMLQAVVDDAEYIDGLLEKSYKPSKDGEDSVYDVYMSLSDIQKNALHEVIGHASLETDDDIDSSEVKHSDSMNPGDITMTVTDTNVTTNLFEEEGGMQQHVLTHAEMNDVVMTALAGNVESMKQAFLEHADAFGIENIELLFPDAETVSGKTPVMVSRDMGWVAGVMAKVHKSPFSHIRSFYADITADEARAKGYIKGAEKFEEKFPILTRETSAQMIYKRQGLHRQDVIEITSFDVVAWMKQEMVVMIKEELARAILVGDGRSVASPDKIFPDKIRPIIGDDNIYTYKLIFDAGTSALDLIDGITMSREQYKGSGSPVLYCTTAFLNIMLLVRDTTGRRIYPTEAALQAALRVSGIVEVPVLDGITRVDGADTLELLGVYVNLQDYTLGAVKGGELTFFEQFDININKHQYLYETMAAGALTRPNAAVSIEIKVGA